jgi:hypothetical protein
MNSLRKVIHVLAVLAWALWMGGFTFFTSVSLRIGHQIFDDSSEFGFVTRGVTDRLNSIGLLAIILLAAYLASHWQWLSRRVRVLLGTSWLVLAITLGLMFLQHNEIDTYLDFQQRVVTDHESFNVIHSRYKLVSTIQWIAAVVHLAVMLVNPVTRSTRD